MDGCQQLEAYCTSQKKKVAHSMPPNEDEESPLEPAAVAALHAAAAAGDVATVQSILRSGQCPAHAQEEVEGVSALMLAAGGGHGECVHELLVAGAPWNAIDRRGRCAGNHALDAGHQRIVDALVDAAVEMADDVADDEEWDDVEEDWEDA